MTNQSPTPPPGPTTEQVQERLRSAHATGLIEAYRLGCSDVHRDYVHSLSQKVAISDPAPEGCSLVAVDTGEGWALTVENTEGDVVAYLKWPDSWPATMRSKQLIEKGFEIV